MTRYLVKCDFCKKTIKTTDNVVESYQGGTCSPCRRGESGERSYLDAIEKKDKKLQREIEKKMKQGEVVRII